MYIYNPAKMSKEKSTMMRLPHWIVRRTLACLRCLREHSILSHYLLSMLLREKKKLQDELNQLSRNCLKDVESRSTLYKLIYQDDLFPFPLNSRAIPFFRYSTSVRDGFSVGPQSPYLQNPKKKHSIFDAFNTAAM